MGYTFNATEHDVVFAAFAGGFYYLNRVTR